MDLKIRHDGLPLSVSLRDPDDAPIGKVVCFLDSEGRCCVIVSNGKEKWVIRFKPDPAGYAVIAGLEKTQEVKQHALGREVPAPNA